MYFFSIWPMAALVAVGLLMLSNSKLFAFLDEPPTASHHRFETLDGLRAFLAIAVLFHHLAAKRWQLASGEHGLPPSHFYALLGEAGVAMFFMITGNLFWGRLIDKQGRIDWIDLYLNRFFRIAPLYVFVAAIYVIAVLYRSQSTQPAGNFPPLIDIVQWMAFGISSHPAPLFNDMISVGIIGPTWTLYYEWKFYFALPILAALARAPSPLTLCLSAITFVLCFDDLVPDPFKFYVSHFLVGMVSASMVRAHPGLNRDGIARSLTAIAFLACGFYFCNTAYSTLAVILFGAFFILISSGASLFGLLRLTGAKRMGNASYSVYMLHGLAITVVLSPSLLGIYAVKSPMHFWAVSGLVFLGSICMAILSYSVVERGGVRLGLMLRNKRKYQSAKAA